MKLGIGSPYRIAPPAPARRRSIMPIIVAVMALAVGALASVAACTPEQKHVARTAVDLAEANCVIIAGATDNETIDKVCATAEELAPYVRMILRDRKAGKPGAALAASASVEKK